MDFSSPEQIIVRQKQISQERNCKYVRNMENAIWQSIEVWIRTIQCAICKGLRDVSSCCQCFCHVLIWMKLGKPGPFLCIFLVRLSFFCRIASRAGRIYVCEANWATLSLSVWDWLWRGCGPRYASLIDWSPSLLLQILHRKNSVDRTTDDDSLVPA